MKVLFVFNHPAPYKVSFFSQLSKKLDIFVVFERNKAKNRPEEFYAQNIYDFPHIFLKKGAFGNENSNTAELKDYIKENYKNFDLIVMNGYSTFSEMRAINYLNKKKIPFTLMINGGIKKEKEFFLKRMLKKKFICSARNYLSPSVAANEYLVFYGAKEELIFNYPYSTLHESQLIKKTLTQEEKDELRKKWGLPLGKLFVNPAQFIKRKNNEQLLEIFKGRKENLLLIGNGPLKEEYQKYIAQNNMKNVYIMDYLPNKDVLEILSCSTAHITLSKEDIYGHTIHESLSMGVPAISSKEVIAARTLLKDGYNGFVVPLENSAVIKAIESVSEEMSQNAYISAKENTIEQTAIKVATILKELK